MLRSLPVRILMGTATELAAYNYVLRVGQLALETDTGKFKFGDGATHYVDLDPFTPGSGAIGAAICQTLTDGANVAWDLRSGGQAKVTLGGNRTLSNPTNMVAGAIYTLRVKQDGTGGRTLAYGPAFLWPSDVPPTLTVDADGVDVLTWLCDGTDMIPLAAVFDVK